jgi:H+/Cl- antiporter ClcA
MPFGSQGPFTHIGGALGGLTCFIARGFAKRASRKLCRKDANLESIYASSFSSATQLRIFVASGSAAGIAAQFNAPLCGVFFVMAESQVFWSQRASTRVFICCTVLSIWIMYWRGSFKGDMTAFSHGGQGSLWNFSSGPWNVSASYSI